MSDRGTAAPGPGQAGSAAVHGAPPQVPRRNPGMSIKSKLLAAVATLTMVGGLGTAGALSASAATPSCGRHCIDIFSREFGTHRSPNFVLDVWRQGAKVGQPIILYRTSNTEPAEDFVPSIQGQ